jgi:hypothetical protein
MLSEFMAKSEFPFLNSSESPLYYRASLDQVELAKGLEGD